MMTQLNVACGTEVSRTVCPSLVTYSKEFQAKAADQLRDLGKTEVEIKQLLGDYMKLRAACRSLKND